MCDVKKDTETNFLKIPFSGGMRMEMVSTLQDSYVGPG